MSNNITHSFYELSDIHAQLFSLVHYTEQTSSRKNVNAVNDKIIKRLDKLSERIKLFQADAQHEISLQDSEEIFFDILQKLQYYRISVLKSIEQVAVKPELSHKHLIEATEIFNAINRLFSTIGNRIRFYADIKMQAEIDAANTLFWSLGLAVLAALCFLIWLAFDVVINLSGRVKVLGSALKQLHDGNTQITLPDYPSDSEMAGMIKAVERFKTVLDEMDSTKSSLYQKNQQLHEEREQRLILQRELRHSLRDLNKVVAMDKTSSEMKNNILGHISHELGTQLNGIIEITERLLNDRLEEKQHDDVQTIGNTGEQLLLILNNILDYSRIETRQFAMQYSSFSLGELLDELMPIFKDKAFAKKIVLNVNIAADVPDKNYGDPNRIRQVLFNLIHNAIKFTEYGKVEVNVSKGDKDQVGKTFKQDLCPWENKEFSSDCNWHVLSFEIVDTGVGIPKEKQEHLFVNALHHDESIAAESCDTGFGLAIVKQLIDLMDGEIGIESRFYQGTRVWFRICLPCLSDDE